MTFCGFEAAPITRLTSLMRQMAGQNEFRGVWFGPFTEMVQWKITG